MLLSAQVATWGIAALATAGVILRPFAYPEAVWALAGAAALVGFGLLPWEAAAGGVLKGVDVYLFLTGMMLLAELARQEGLFDWLAARAASLARGSATRLFALVYVVGIVVTVFLSNDATAVVLTPAVSAVARAAKVERPLPYLLICAFTANAASFVLPISNPANLVIYGSQMPPLLEWLPRFALPSLLSIAATYAVLRFSQRHSLAQPVASHIAVPDLSRAGKTAAGGIAATAVVLMLASALGLQLGLPTCIAGLVTLGGVALLVRASPWRYLREVSWGVIPLVAGLFVLVEALDRSGVLRTLSDILRAAADRSTSLAAAGAGVAVAIGSNLINNLPAGLIAGTAVQSAHVSPAIASAILIGIDVGPNLSVTGSLATILWLAALRREGIHVKSGQFLKLGLLVMPPALILSLAGLMLCGAAEREHAPRSVGCGKQVGTGVFKRTTTDGASRTRTYLIQVPATYQPARAYALSFVFHGSGDNGARSLGWGLQNAPGASDAGLFVFPDGINYRNLGLGWDDTNAGYDIPFFDHMVGDVAASYCIDTSRIFVAGFSWGADFATALSCSRGDTIRAIAVNSASDEFSDKANPLSYQNLPCPSKTHPPVRFVHAMLGDSAYPSPYFATTSKLFQYLNACSGAMTNVPASTPVMTCAAYQSCASAVVECAFAAGIGHALPPNWAADTWKFFMDAPPHP